MSKTLGESLMKEHFDLMDTYLMSVIKEKAAQSAQKIIYGDYPNVANCVVSSIEFRDTDYNWEFRMLTVKFIIDEVERLAKDDSVVNSKKKIIFYKMLANIQLHFSFDRDKIILAFCMQNLLKIKSVKDEILGIPYWITISHLIKDYIDSKLLEECGEEIEATYNKYSNVTVVCNEESINDLKEKAHKYVDVLFTLFQEILNERI